MAERAPGPFAGLRLPLTPLAPRREFTESLRRRLEAEIRGTDPDGAATRSTGPVAATGMMPGLVVHDGAAALRFYEEAMGATITYRFDDGDKVGHAEVAIGDVTFSVADAYPELGFVPPDPDARRQSFTLTLTVPDADAAYERAVAHGATPERPVEDQFYGARTGSFRDPFGHYWSVTTPIPGAEPPPSST